MIRREEGEIGGVVRREWMMESVWAWLAAKLRWMDGAR